MPAAKKAAAPKPATAKPTPVVEEVTEPTVEPAEAVEVTEPTAEAAPLPAVANLEPPVETEGIDASITEYTQEQQEAAVNGLAASLGPVLAEETPGMPKPHLFDEATGGPIDPETAFTRLTPSGNVLVSNVRIIERSFAPPHGVEVTRLTLAKGAHVSGEDARIVLAAITNGTVPEQEL